MLSRHFIPENVGLAACNFILRIIPERFFMKQRIITGAILVASLILVMIFADTFVLPVILALCTAIAIYEMLSCVGLQKVWQISIPFYLCAAFPILMRFLKDDEVLFQSIGLVVLSLGVLYLFTVLIFSHGKYTVQEICVSFMSILYIVAGFTAIVSIYDRELGGEYVYLLVFIGSWVTDTFAYFCGMLFGRGGKHKLIPDVSPKKTVEGSIGGIVFCIIGMVVFGIVVEAISDYEANLIALALAGFVISVVAQIGDLLMSVIKRTYGIKDYGKVFPGHGGVLDRFDSILAVSVVLMVFTSFFDLLG